MRKYGFIGNSPVEVLMMVLVDIFCSVLNVIDDDEVALRHALHNAMHFL